MKRPVTSLVLGRTLIAVVLAVVFGAPAGAAAYASKAAPSAVPGAPRAGPRGPAGQEQAPSQDGPADLSAAFERVAQIIQPSVVNVESVKRVQVSQRAPRELREFFGGDLFEKLFPERRDTQEGLGSGVIISPEGYILTNAHVVQNAERVRVTLPAPDDREFVADVVGTDPLTDLAVIKIAANGLRPAKLGNSDELRVGEWVVAVGNPFGLKSTMTAGIVSATGRSNVGVASYEDLIQTDAAINPGNSGGPLVNLRGEVVGITTAIFSRSGGYMGIGFAIPSNMVEKIMPQLIAEGRVIRGSLGVAIQNLNPGLARTFGYDSASGVLISDVTPSSPAEKAGLQRGDIVVSYRGQPTAKSADLRGMVADTKPGTRVPLEIVRNGKPMSLEVTVGELAEKVQTASHEEKTPSAGSQTKMGITIHDLTPELIRELRLGPEQRGVVVTKVEPLSPADRAGLSVGDVITVVGDRPVKNIDDFKEAMSGQDLSRGVRLEVVSSTRREGPLRRYAFVQTD
ncbi:MAG TPA: DegQ family serine endoprotease [Phycisphaerae bacterium]|jgi:serine protease Do|nr:DegQ family serine endoprotease [Phycisphaerae bacterium]HPC21455.1 DegQ family serine endoprotease [Phycisphaerae bacterium]